MTCNFRYKEKSFGGIARFAFLSVLAFGAIFNAEAQIPINVGGALTQNTEWTTGYEYIVIEDVTVPEGITLTIEAGVIVRFLEQTGLFVEKGTLIASGTQNDTIRFFSKEGQLWKGLSLYSINGASSIIKYIHIDRAEIGIDIRSSNSVMISNSRFTSGYYDDIRLYNSSGCSILNNVFINNSRVGLEILATGNVTYSSGNTIAGNYFDNSRFTCLLVRFELGGACRNNIIERNVFNGAEAGIYIDNSLPVNNDAIFIRNNVFIESGGATIGYSISSGMDNTLISNNIFWKNTMTSVMLRGRNGTLSQNTFYENFNCINLSSKALNAKLYNNTIANNYSVLLAVSQTNEFDADSNNILNNYSPSGSIQNLTANPIDMSSQFWGTLDTAVINDVIYDYYDNQTSGIISYEPFLSSPDTIAPISPPMDPIVQLVNGNTLLRWRRNPESDVKGYNIYNGQFARYKFSSPPLFVGDTVLMLEGYHVHDNMAVTAIDNGYFEFQQNTSGNESAFAFFRIMPFAGLDTSVCSDQDFFRIRYSNIPFNYQSFEWLTEGDGFFSNPATLHPDYYPGNEDRNRGWVRLRLVVFRDGVEIEDSFKLIISKLPTISASDVIFNLYSEYVLLSDVSAEWYEDIVWETDGDGYFEDPHTINTVYYFGDEDTETGEAILKLTASSACGSNSVSIKVLIRKTFSLEGSVLNNGIGVEAAAVLAITGMEGTIPEISAITHASSDGTFRFDSLFAAPYRFYALPDTLNDDNLLPTYYYGKTFWESGYVLNLTDNTYHVEIDLQKINTILPEGEGVICGKFELPEGNKGLDNYCVPWFSDISQTYCSDGLSNVTIFLYDPMLRIPLAWTVTDSEGEFTFRGLPFGTYVIKAEKTGYDSGNEPYVELNEETKVQCGIIIRMERNLKILIETPEIPSEALRVFPNPSSGYVHISGNDFSDVAIIEVYNMYGQMAKRIVPESIGDNEIIISVSDLYAGFYTAKLVTPNKLHSISFIVR